MRFRERRYYAVCSFEDGSVIDAFCAESKARKFMRSLNDDAPEEQAYLKRLSTAQACLPVEDMAPDRS